jgi:hypothetical protein
MKTAYLLAAQYLPAQGRNGKIPLPVIRMEESQKGARGVHVENLARYVDERREAALKEMRQLAG